MKKKILIIVSILVVLVIALVGLYCYSITAVSDSYESVTFVINSGDSKEEIATNLRSANLVRSKYATLVYIILTGSNNLQAGEYELNRNMSVGDIINAFVNGDIIGTEADTVSITFKEGIRLTEYLELIADSTKLEYDEIVDEINDQDFLASLVDEYWFLTDEILDDQLYYALEGYLYPETYEFYYDTTLSDVVNKILSVTDTKLSSIKSELEKSEFSIHEILTMASIVELEAVTYTDRCSVAQVIYKRLELGMNLGMDVTTYYGVGKEMGQTLTTTDLNDENPYNTRVSSFTGLPVGAICNPSLDAIRAVLNPSDTDYIYFYADVTTGDVYFTDSYNEFLVFKEMYS